MRGYTLFEVVGNPERMAKGKQYVPDGLASGKLKPIIAKTFPFEKIVDAQEQRANWKDADATRPQGERHRCASIHECVFRRHATSKRSSAPEGPSYPRSYKSRRQSVPLNRLCAAV